MSTPFPLADIAAAQAARSIMAFDRGHLQRTLTRRQQIYATRLAQSEALSYVFDEGNVEVVVRSDSQKLVLHLGEAAQDIYPALRDALDEQLHTFGSEIVRLHLELEQAALDDAQYPTPGPDFVPTIRALCTLAILQPEVSVPTPTSLASRHAGTAVIGTGLGSTGGTATAVAA